MKFDVLKKQSIPILPEEIADLKGQRESSTMRDTGLLILRLVVGGLITGHGSQKLFGWFSGPGLKGTAGWLESLGLKPGTPWAMASSTAEFGGGILTTLGFLHPLGPLATIGAMIMATVKGHWGKPIWGTQGGAELPVIYMTSALALMFTGPGVFSLDRVFHIRLPRAVVMAIAIVEACMVAIGIMSRPTSSSPPAAEDQAPISAKADRVTGM